MPLALKIASINALEIALEFALVIALEIALEIALKIALKITLKNIKKNNLDYCLEKLCWKSLKNSQSWIFSNLVY